jgi:hypothetical protein
MVFILKLYHMFTHLSRKRKRVNEQMFAHPTQTPKKKTSFLPHLKDEGFQRSIFMKKSSNTQFHQQQGLAIFCTYLAEAHVNRTTTVLYDDPDAWSGITRA